MSDFTVKTYLTEELKNKIKAENLKEDIQDLVKKALDSQNGSDFLNRLTIVAGNLTLNGIYHYDSEKKAYQVYLSETSAPLDILGKLNG